MVEHCLASTRERVQTPVLPERKKEERKGGKEGRNGLRQILTLKDIFVHLKY
jgi:hypothetical protein